MVNPLSEELQYLYGLERFGIKLGLEVMEELLDELGNPHQTFRSVHITGTNGKGSTASFIESVLRETGINVGLYTSPHLYRFNERVRVNGTALTDDQLLSHIATIRDAAARRTIQPTFFEFTTALAFLEFARQRVALAVVEVGMGGILDATNVITPDVAVITNVGLDHTPMIGTNKSEIAQNKAGIIKPGCMVVTAETNPALLAIFESVSRQHNATLHHVDRELSVSQRLQSLTKQTFTISTRTKHRLINTGSLTPGVEGTELVINMLGQHQIRNACTALLALLQLRERGINIPDQAIKDGLAYATWEGRLDIVSRQPFILVDGAHNNDGVESLAAFLDEMKEQLPPADVLLVAAKRDKNVEEMLRLIVPRFKHVVATQGNYEPMPAGELVALIEGVKKNVQAIPNVSEAVAAAKKLQSPTGMLLVTGSLYMVGDALPHLRQV